MTTETTIPTDPDQPLTEPEAAWFTRLCERTLRRARNRGELRAARIGRRVLYRRRDLLAYLDSKTR